MEENETTENLEGQVGANAEIAGAENQGQQQENITNELSWQEQAIAHAKENGREVTSFDELLRPVEVEKEVIKEVNPYESLLDEEDKAYFNFKKETGRTRKEFEALSVDVDSLNPLEVAREQARRDIGVSSLKPELADQHIADKLGIDLDDMSEFDELKLLGYGKAIRDEKKSHQAQYRQPIENKPEPKQESTESKYVQLPGGVVQRKEDFEAAQALQLKQKEEAVQAVKTVSAASFNLPVDNDGTITNVAIPYAYGDEDHRVMESIVSDVPGVMQKRYASEKGFNHSAFAEDLLWSDKNFREKAISDIAAKAHANAVEETLKRVGNHNFKPDQPIETQLKEGVRMVAFRDLGK